MKRTCSASRCLHILATREVKLNVYCDFHLKGNKNVENHACFNPKCTSIIYYDGQCDNGKLFWCPLEKAHYVLSTIKLRNKD